MTIQELAKLAKYHGFESKFVSDKPYKYSNKENLRLMFWLTELKHFVFNKWDTSIDTQFRSDQTFEFYIRYRLDEDFKEDASNTVFYTEVEALKEGLVKFLSPLL